MRVHHMLAAAIGLAPVAHAAAQTAPAPASPAARAEESIPMLDDAVIERLERRLRAMRQASERATNPVVARGVTRPLTVSLAPGGGVPIVNTVKGYLTTLAFRDNTGQPWPIHWEMSGNPNQPGSTDCNNGAAQAATAGNGAAIPGAVFTTGFQVCVPVKGGNVMVVTTYSESPMGGLSVMLEGADAPLVFQLHATPSSYDANISVTVAQRGPKARTEMFTNRRGGPVTGEASLTAMLDGTPPANAVPLLVRGATPDAVQAWRIGDQMYIRTSALVISPQPVAREYTTGGVGIFAIPASPVVLASVQGRTFSLSLSGPER